MMHCNVIQDLLPLYVDQVCSQQTKQLVEEHISTCEGCKNIMNEMQRELKTNLEAPRLDEKRIFQNILKTVLGIVWIGIAIITCIITNTIGGFRGDPAQIGNLIVSMLYVVFWFVFTKIVKAHKTLTKVSFFMSVCTCIAGIIGVICRVTSHGGFIVAIFCTIASIPFYGFEYLVGWTGVYAMATVCAVAWMVYVLANLRKNDCEKNRKMVV